MLTTLLPTIYWPNLAAQKPYPICPSFHWSKKEKPGKKINNYNTIKLLAIFMSNIWLELWNFFQMYLFLYLKFWNNFYLLKQFFRNQTDKSFANACRVMGKSCHPLINWKGSLTISDGWLHNSSSWTFIALFLFAWGAQLLSEMWKDLTRTVFMIIYQLLVLTCLLNQISTCDFREILNFISFFLKKKLIYWERKLIILGQWTLTFSNN